MAPGPAGHPGQLIVYDNADVATVERTVVARDFHALLAWMDAEAGASRLIFDCGNDTHDHVEQGCSLRHAHGWSLLSDLVDRANR